jgi:hypothetical protein
MNLASNFRTSGKIDIQRQLPLQWLDMDQCAIEGRLCWFSSRRHMGLVQEDSHCDHDQTARPPRAPSRQNGEISRKHGNTLISTLRQTYGQDLAPNIPGHTKLSDVLHQLDGFHLAGA